MLDDGSKKCLTLPQLNSPSCPHRSPPPQPHRLPRPLPRDCSTLLRRHPTLIWAMMNQMQHRHPANGKFFPKRKRERFQISVWSSFSKSSTTTRDVSRGSRICIFKSVTTQRGRPTRVMRRLLLRLRRGEKEISIGKSSESLSEKIIQKINCSIYFLHT